MFILSRCLQVTFLSDKRSQEEKFNRQIYFVMRVCWHGNFAIDILTKSRAVKRIVLKNVIRVTFRFSTELEYKIQTI